MTRWQGWHAAFEEASRSPDRGRVRLTVSPDDFARALAEFMGFAQSERGQDACRSGLLCWYDARGRCVILTREGSEGAMWDGPTEAYANRPDYPAPGAVSPLWTLTTGADYVPPVEARSLHIGPPPPTAALSIHRGMPDPLNPGKYIVPPETPAGASYPSVPPPPTAAVPREESTSKGQIRVPPGLEDAEIRSVGYAGNVQASAPGTPAWMRVDAPPPSEVKGGKVVKKGGKK